MLNEALSVALETIDRLSPNQDLVSAKCRGLMAGYVARWGAPDFTVLEVENTVHSDLYNPETKAKSRTFGVAGKMDLIAFRDDRRVLFDHKTTSDDIKDPAGPYWRQLVVEAQPSHYALLEWLNGRKVDEIVWDVIRKPAIRPKAITKADVSDISRYRHYQGFPLDDGDVDFARTEGRESLRLYEYRLARETMDHPENYFQRRTVPRMDAEIHEHATELWEYGQEIIQARRMNRHPRNSGACMNYGRPCVYLGICSGYDEPTSDKWKRKTQVHNELQLSGTDGRDVLTNSRLTVFKTCRRKHYFQYELGISRVEEEEAEALWFGSLWHSALEAYFKYFQKGQYGNINNAQVSEARAAGNVARA